MADIEDRVSKVEAGVKSCDTNIDLIYKAMGFQDKADKERDKRIDKATTATGDIGKSLDEIFKRLGTAEDTIRAQDATIKKLQTRVVNLEAVVSKLKK